MERNNAPSRNANNNKLIPNSIYIKYNDNKVNIKFNLEK